MPASHRAPAEPRHGWVWGPAGRDLELARAISDLTTGGYWGSAREVLAVTRTDFDRRAHCSNVLSAVLVLRNLSAAVETWIRDEPDNPDARLLHARVAVREAINDAKHGGAREVQLLANATKLCRTAAEYHPADPTPWVALLALGEVGPSVPELLEPAAPAPDGLQAHGPWGLLAQITERDPYNREAFHRLIPCIRALSAPGVGGGEDLGDLDGPYPVPGQGAAQEVALEQRALAKAQAAVAVWAADRAPEGSPLKLLKLLHAPDADPNPNRAEAMRLANYLHSNGPQAPVAQYLRERVAVIRESWRLSLNALAVQLSEAWFSPGADPPYMPPSDASLLADYLHRAGAESVALRTAARNVLAWMIPYATTEPWARRGRPAEVLRSVCLECGFGRWELPD